VDNPRERFLVLVSFCNISSRGITIKSEIKRTRSGFSVNPLWDGHDDGGASVCWWIVQREFAPVSERSRSHSHSRSRSHSHSHSPVAMTQSFASSVVARVVASDAFALACALALCASACAVALLRAYGTRHKGDAPASTRDDGFDARGKVRLTVFYGTQTGTSERYAREVAAHAAARYKGSVAARAVDLETINALDAEDALKREDGCCVFLQSTYGDGEPTDTSTDFVYWARDTASDGRLPELLSGLTFSVFGLGNRSYEHFNAAAKMVHQALVDLGGAPLLKLHLGDDDQCLEQDFENWREAFWPAFESKFGLHSEGGLEEDLPRYDVIDMPGVEGERAALSQASKYDKEHSTARVAPTAAKPYLSTVKAVRELNGKGADRSCVHVEFDVAGANVHYKHGDHLGVYAENSADITARAAKALKCDPNRAFRLSKPADASASLAEPFSTPCTVKTAIARYADVLSAPRKQALAALASVAVGKDAQKLAFLASPAGKDEFATYITKPHRSLLEVMEDFPSAVPDLGLFFGAIAPRLAPRFYSISSSPAQDKNIITATVAVVKEKVATGRVHEGVASTFLQRALEGQKIPVFVRTSTFRLPTNPEAPVIMIGPGTGYAPFRGFLQERQALKASGEKLGPAMLFFGCRTERNDFIYREEMEQALADGVITSLNVAFSRDGPKKVYVQDKIIDKGPEVYGILKGTIGKNEGQLYVCGDAKNMAKDVNKALLSVLMREGDYAAHEAEEIIRRLTSDFRYHKDVW